MKKLPLSLDISLQFFQGSKTTQRYEVVQVCLLTRVFLKDQKKKKKTPVFLIFEIDKMINDNDKSFNQVFFLKVT